MIFFYKKSRYPVYHELFVRMQIPLCSSVCWRWLRPKGEDRQENWKPFEPCLNARSVQELRDYVNFSREKCKWTSTLKSIRFYLHDLVFKSGVYIIINKITKPECFLDFFTAIKYICMLALLILFTYQNVRFPQPFIYFNKCNPHPFIYLKAEKGTPFGRSLPVLGHYRKYHSGSNLTHPPNRMVASDLIKFPLLSTMVR